MARTASRSQPPEQSVPSAEPLFGNIPVDQIDVPEDHARKAHTDREELKQSMAEGLLHPIVVRQTGPERYELIAGARRLFSARDLGWVEIACQVRDADLVTKHVLRTIENVQREQLDPIEEAKEYRVLNEEDGLSPQDIARRVGRSALHVSQRLALLRLPEEYQALINTDQEGTITLGEALELSRLAGHLDLIEAAHKAICAKVPAANAVQAQLAALERRLKVAQAKRDLAEHGKTLFEGVAGRDGFLYSREDEPGYMYWPAEREMLPENTVWMVDGEGMTHPVCTNPLQHMSDPDQRIAASAQALVQAATPAGTATAPDKPVSPEDAARVREREERKHWKEVRKQDELREQHLTKICRGGIKTADTDLFLELLFWGLSGTMRETVLARCNVPKKAADEAAGFGEEWDLAKWMEGRGSWLKLARAAALQLAEDQVDQATKDKVELLPPGDSTDRLIRYFQHLEGTGYVLTPAEIELAGMETKGSGEEPDQEDKDGE